jgi:hypothetical protein
VPPTSRPWPSSPLAAAQRAFDLLCSPPAPLTFDGRGFDGLPDRILDLAQLKAVLLRRATPPAVRDAVWRELVIRARRDGPAWVVAAVGVAMPGLVAAAGALAAGWRGDRADVDAEMLVGFVERLHTVDVDAPRVCGRLLDAAVRAGRRARAAEGEAADESIADTAYNLDEQVSNALVDAFSHQLDLGPLTGTGDVDNQPTGVVRVADESTGDSLWSAAAAAIGELGEAGGAANTVALGAAAAATEAARVGDDGHPVYPDGLATFQGLNVVRVPGLTTPLVYDAARVYLVEREDFSVEQSAHAAWRTDGLSLRVKARSSTQSG